LEVWIRGDTGYNEGEQVQGTGLYKRNKAEREKGSGGQLRVVKKIPLPEANADVFPLVRRRGGNS
jgi:hypothetical protein